MRWESAQMIIDAAKRQRSIEAQTYYILSATGMPMMGQGRGQGGQEKKTAPSAEERRNAMVARMKESTMLERKGKDPIYPERVEILETNNVGELVALTQTVLAGIFPLNSTFSPNEYHQWRPIATSSFKLR